MNKGFSICFLLFFSASQTLASEKTTEQQIVLEEPNSFHSGITLNIPLEIDPLGPQKKSMWEWCNFECLKPNDCDDCCVLNFLENKYKDKCLETGKKSHGEGCLAGCGIGCAAGFLTGVFGSIIGFIARETIKNKGQ